MKYLKEMYHDIIIEDVKDCPFCGTQLSDFPIIMTVLPVYTDEYLLAKLNKGHFLGSDNYFAVKCIQCGAKIEDVKHDEYTAFFALQCPEKGAFIGFKKCGDKIVELQITEDAKRSSSTSRKCRCSKAKVLSITSIDGKKEITEAASDYDANFTYQVGEMIEVENFDDNRWNECSTGIHFFITRDEAVQYGG